MPQPTKICLKSGKALIVNGAIAHCCCCEECLPACCKPDDTCEAMPVADCEAIGGRPGVRYGWPYPTIAWQWTCCDEPVDCQEQLNYQLDPVCEGQICYTDACCEVHTPPVCNQTIQCCICVGQPIMPNTIDIVFPAMIVTGCNFTYSPFHPICSGAKGACCNQLCAIIAGSVAGILSQGISMTRQANPCQYSGTVCQTLPGYDCPHDSLAFNELTCGSITVCVTVSIWFGPTPTGQPPSRRIEIGVSGSGACSQYSYASSITVQQYVAPTGQPLDCSQFEFQLGNHADLTPVDPDAKVVIST